jgi:hypothetical protein
MLFLLLSVCCQFYFSDSNIKPPEGKEKVLFVPIAQKIKGLWAQLWWFTPSHQSAEPQFCWKGV